MYIVLRDHDGTLERWMRHPSRKVGQSLINHHTLDPRQSIANWPDTCWQN